MTKTIRERIENTKSNDWLNVGNPRLALLDILWRAGNLLPTDEADASVEAARLKGMERAAVICDRRSVMVEARGCAVAIRADMEAEDEKIQR